VTHPTMSPLRHLLHLGRMRNSWVLSQGLWRGRWHRMLQGLVQRRHGGDGGCTRLGGHWGRRYGRLCLHCCCHCLLLLLLLLQEETRKSTISKLCCGPLYCMTTYHAHCSALHHQNNQRHVRSLS